MLELEFGLACAGGEGSKRVTWATFARSLIRLLLLRRSRHDTTWEALIPLKVTVTRRQPSTWLRVVSCMVPTT